MAMYHDESVSQETLRKHFTAARHKGVRYVAVMQQIIEDYYVVTCDQQVISAHDDVDIVRQVRGHGLRPHAPRTSLVRLLDTRADFNTQAAMDGQETLACNFTPDAQAAYARYQEALAQREVAPARKGWIGRLFSR